MAAKENGVLSKNPSEMTADEMRAWDECNSRYIENVALTVSRHRQEMQALEDTFEAEMFAAGLWTYEAPPAASSDPLPSQRVREGDDTL